MTFELGIMVVVRLSVFTRLSNETAAQLITQEMDLGNATPTLSNCH